LRKTWQVGEAATRSLAEVGQRCHGLRLNFANLESPQLLLGPSLRKYLRMSIFAKRNPEPVVAPRRVPPMGSGLRLNSQHSVSRCLDLLERMILKYRQPTPSSFHSGNNEYIPSYFYPGWVWNGASAQEPAIVVSFTDRDKHFILMAFWPKESGAEIGVFPLGGEAERHRYLAVADEWEQLDGSVTRSGLFEPGLITLSVPPLPRQFFAEVLEVARFPATENNIAQVAYSLGRVLLSDADRFIASRDKVAADKFVSEHSAEHFRVKFPSRRTEEFPAWILSELVNWSADLLPYIQELPMRRRAIILDGVGLDVPLWRMLDR
jgi:hypothetical protein